MRVRCVENERAQIYFKAEFLKSVLGHKWQLALCCSDLGIIIKSYIRLSTRLSTSSLGSGGGGPSCRRHLARAFHTQVGALMFDGPARFRGCSPNKSKSPLHTFPVRWVLFICNLFYLFSVPAFQGWIWGGGVLDPKVGTYMYAHCRVQIHAETSTEEWNIGLKTLHSGKI